MIYETPVAESPCVARHAGLKAVLLRRSACSYEGSSSRVPNTVVGRCAVLRSRPVVDV